MKLEITKSYSEKHPTKEIIDTFLKKRVEALKKKGFKNVAVNTVGDQQVITYEAKQ